MHDHFSVGT